MQLLELVNAFPTSECHHLAVPCLSISLKKLSVCYCLSEVAFIIFFHEQEKPCTILGNW